MNKIKMIAMLLCGFVCTTANAQDAFDVLQMSQNELRGTSRFMSMAGAFGALGGDLSTLTQNPGGIGVYRSSDVGITFSLDCNSSDAGVGSINQTKFNVNNVGYVGAFRFDGPTLKNLNFGFTFNRVHSFNRHYSGGFADINNSMSNYIAGWLNDEGFTSEDLVSTSTFNPYFSGYAPWIGIVSYDMPTSYSSGSQGGSVGIVNERNGGMRGMFDNGTTGSAYFEVEERGHVDEYNIAFGGNFANKVYWGFDFGINDLDYKSYNYYEESLTNAYIKNGSKTINENTDADFAYENYLHSSGTGVNFKFGLIVRPISALRIGAAFHTPTYYNMRDTYYVGACLSGYENGEELYYAEKGSNDGYDYTSDYTIRTPWRFMGSLAGVIGTKGIISMDYEYVANQTMRIGDDGGNVYPDVTDNVKNYFKPSHIIRLGGEYRLNPAWSLRAGYSYKTTQVEKVIDDYETTVATVSTNPAYQYDNSVQYITCGAGYKHKSFYADLAYVHKYRQSVYNAFSPVAYSDGYYEPNLSADVKDHNNRISLTLGVRF